MSGAGSGDGRDGRVGDATRQRIEGLKDGWKLPTTPESSAPAEPPRLPPPRRQPPPPPKPERDTEKQERPLSASELGGPAGDEDQDTLDRGDVTRAQAPEDRPRKVGKASGQVRRPAVLRRKRGLLGDVRYVFTAAAGVTSARRELAEAHRKIEGERGEREQRLLALARQVLAEPGTPVPWVDDARDLLSRIEDARAGRAGRAAAAEAELESIRRAADSEAEAGAEALAKAEKELAALTGRLEPLERQAAAARKRAAALHASLAEIDRKLAARKSGRGGAKGGLVDPVALEAEVAAIKAERQAVAAGEPEIAAELDDLEPKVASLQSARAEAERRIADLRAEASEARIRTEEKLTAVRAAKAVDDRGVADADRDRDRALREMGERLVVERPEALTPRMRAIDTHDAAIATLERRALELSELVNGVDRMKLARGLALLLLVSAAVAAVAVYLLWLR